MALVLTAVSAMGSDDRFYGDMLRRGVADAMRGANDRAVVELRIAAFGSIDSLADYQTAEIYLALACERLGRHDDSRTAAQKAIQAERITPVYAALTLDAQTKSAFEKFLPQSVGADRISDVPAFSHLARPASSPTTTAKTPPSRTLPVAPAPSTAVAPKQQPPATSAPVTAPLITSTAKPKPAPVPQSLPATPVPAPKQQAIATPPPVTPSRPLTTDPVIITTSPQPRPPSNATITPRVDPVAQTPPPQSRPVVTMPSPQPPAPAPQTVMSPLAAAAKHQPSVYATEATGPIAEAQRLLNEGKMIAARQAFLRIAQTPDASRSLLLDAAKGLCETNAWNDSSLLYAKLDPLKRGEEAHYFYEAINRYELGDDIKARELLTRALPYLPNTREVALYRGKIEGATQ